MCAHIARDPGLGSGYVFPLRETFAAQDWPPLGWPERDGRLFAALRAGSPGFNPREVVGVPFGGWGGEDGHALRLAGLTTLGFVLELFIVEKQLFPGGEDEVGTAVDARQYLILKFH